MDLKALAGRKVNLTIISLSQNGGASLTMPGLSSISASYNNNNSSYSAPYMVDSTEGFNASATFNPNLSAWPTVFATDQDQAYMESVLQMKLRLQQSMVAVPDPEYTLYVLVDVLGTNRSKVDSIIYSKDILLATCEVTYYVFDIKAAKVLGTAKRAGSQSGYLESGWFGFSGSHVERSMCDTEPTAMPTDVNDPVVVTADPIMAVGLKPKSQPVSPRTQEMDKKLREAESYIQAGNASAAERLLNEIRAYNANYPGLDAAFSRLTAIKSAKPAQAQADQSASTVAADTKPAATAPAVPAVKK
jgi:hypothetical protein